VILALGLAGRNQLLAYLEDFLSLLGYWSTTFFVIIFSEHIIFRKGKISNYNLEGWNDPKAVPVGIAAGCAFACGVVAFVMGMVSSSVRSFVDLTNTYAERDLVHWPIGFGYQQAVRR